MDLPHATKLSLKSASDEKSAAFVEISGDTYGDTLVRNLVQLNARRCRSTYLFKYQTTKAVCS